MGQSVIVIPARYHSTRFPGKPLAKIAGQSMLARVHAIAKQVANADVTVVVATDDQRIADHCVTIDAACVLTPRDCRTGTDRALAAIEALAIQPNSIINLQGDAPLTPPHFIQAILTALNEDQSDIVTPVTQLTWSELDKLRAIKTSTPFSGTTAILDQHDNALWFSKAIIPAIRKEQQLREASPLSPVFRHIGLYGYRYAALKQMVNLAESRYERLEGLEQLRALENGLTIRCVKVDYQGLPAMSGVDSPEDVKRVEALL